MTTTVRLFEAAASDPSNVVPDRTERQRAARTLEEALERSRAPEILLSAARFKLSASRPTEAIRLLSEAIETRSDWAPAFNDLGAAYLLRATADRPALHPIDLVRALEALEQARRLDPRSAEVLFNRAQALEELKLTETAARAWRTYVALDSERDWRELARTRLERLETLRKAPSPADERARLPALANRGSDDALRNAVAAKPEVARLLVEEELLGEWGKAIEAGRPKEAAALLSDAGRIAAVLREVNGETMPGDAVAAIERADGSARPSLVSGHVAFQSALEHYRAYRWDLAAASFRKARLELARGGSPFALWALAQLAQCVYYSADYPATVSLLEELARAGQASRYNTLLARRLWTLGLVYASTGRGVEAIDPHVEAAARFRRVGEPAHSGFLEGIVGRHWRLLGSTDKAWDHYFLNLAQLSALEDRGRFATVLWECGAAALELQAPRAALAFFEELAQSLDLGSDSLLYAETLLKRAQVERRLGELESAKASLVAVQSTLAKIPAAFRSRVSADLAAAQGWVLRASDPASAAKALGEALNAFSGVGYEVHTVALLRERAAAFRALGHIDLAEADLRTVIERHESTRLQIGSASQRTQYFDAVRGVVDDMIELQWKERNDPIAALGYAERARARTILDRRGFDTRDLPKLSNPTRIRQLLPQGIAILEYAVLDQRLLMWLLTSEGVKSFEQSLSSSTLAAEVQGLLESFGQPLVDGIAGASVGQTPSVRLFATLIAPLRAALAPQTLLVVVPDKALHGVPFAALLDPRTGRALVQDFPIVIAPSATVLAQDLAGPRRNEEAVRRALIVANGGMSLEPESGSQRRSNDIEVLPSLPGARAEATRIARLWPTARLLIDSDATHFLALLPNYEVIHVAAHGINSTASPEASALVLGEPSSGMATRLAYGRDIEALPLRRNQAVVLASCASAVGGVPSLEGSHGLARAFLAAGVGAVIASLWAIPDEPTSTFLEQVHSLMATGESPAVALQAAQIKAIKAARAGQRVPWPAFQAFATSVSVGWRAVNGQRVPSIGEKVMQ